jgi:hypothetical protein
MPLPVDARRVARACPRTEPAMMFRRGPSVVARFPHTNGGFTAYAVNVKIKLTGNQALPNPPNFVAYVDDVDALVVADGIKHKTPADRADRDAKALKVYRHLVHFADYVQARADEQVSANDAIALILSSGLDVRKTGSHKKPELCARYTGISGEVLLVARAIAEAGAYFWEYSVDQKSWFAAPETTKGRTTIAGLTPGLVYHFRFRALTKQGKLAYVQPVSLMVH